MPKYRKPRLRIVRRLGRLPGLTAKKPKKLNPPGDHGEAQNTIIYKRRLSAYCKRLKEKQKLRYHYGISERQLTAYVRESRKKKGSSGRMLLTLLEMRLDNILFRLGFAPTIPAAKQLINHGHIFVDGKPVTVPSYSCKLRTHIKVNNSLKSQNLVKSNLIITKRRRVPNHLLLFKGKLEAIVKSLVVRKSISLFVKELLVIEHYSRRL